MGDLEVMARRENEGGDTKTLTTTWDLYKIDSVFETENQGPYRSPIE
jgi:hypothetical protein